MMLLDRINGTGEQRSNPAEKASQENLCVDDDCSDHRSLRSCLSTSNLSTSMRSSNGGLGSRNVSFHEVNIREYEITVSDNPSVSNGVPIGIDWGYEEQQTVCVNTYEESRTPRAELTELKISAMERKSLLKDNGCSYSVMQNAEKHANINRRKRRVTNNMSPAMESASIVMEKVSRNIFKVVSLNSKERKLAAMMKGSGKYSFPKSYSAGDFATAIVPANSNGKVSRRMSMPNICTISKDESEATDEEVMNNHDTTNNTVYEVPLNDTKRKLQSDNVGLLDRNIIEKIIPTDCDNIDALDEGIYF